MMNISMKKKLAIVSATIASLLSVVSSASAVSNPTSFIARGCTCNGKPVPENLCPLIHCPDAAEPSNDTNQIQAQHSIQSPLLIAHDWFGWERLPKEPKPR